MRRKIISIITALILMSTYVSVSAENTDEKYIWDLTTLTASDYNADKYVALDDVFSVKANSSYVTSDGIKATKGNGVRIKIAPLADGKVTVSYRGGGKAILPDYENRKGGEENIISDIPVEVTAGKIYYLQASTGDSAVISAVKYTAVGEFPSKTPAPTEKPTAKPSETPIPTPTATPKPTAQPNMVFDKIWDLTALSASDYSADKYTAADDIVSVKSEAKYITADGIKVSKGNGVRIKLVPEADGKLMISATHSVIMPNYENRKGTEDTISDNELVDVYAGVEYYIQGNSSSETVIKAIHFKENTFELFKVTGIGFNESYTKIMEFDVEKGDDYDYAVTACVCVYGGDGVLKKVDIRKIFSNSLNIGVNTVKCDIDITGYDREKDTVKIFLLTGLE